LFYCFFGLCRFDGPYPGRDPDPGRLYGPLFNQIDEIFTPRRMGTAAPGPVGGFFQKPGPGKKAGPPAAPDPLFAKNALHVPIIDTIKSIVYTGTIWEGICRR
jgi:hypothetical protein